MSVPSEFGEELMTVQPRQRKAEHQDVDKKEGKVLRVFSSGRWLPQTLLGLAGNNLLLSQARMLEV